MLGALKFVMGAVAKKDFVPEMQHFAIRDGRVTAFNGVLALSSPVDIDIVCAPLAGPMVRAIAQCSDVASLSLRDNGRLAVRSGRFTANVPCVPIDDLPTHQPSGQRVDIDGEALLGAFRALLPFVGDDATRPWANGVLLDQCSGFATNNVCLVQYWLGVNLPVPVTLPRAAINEVLRVGMVPEAVTLDQHSIAFIFGDGRWIRTALLTGDWPDVAALLDRPSDPQPVPASLFSGLAAIKPFADRDQYVTMDGTQMTVGDADLVSAKYEIEDAVPRCIFKLSMLQLLDGVAQRMDFREGQGPAAFFGENIRGVIAGASR